MSIETVMEYPGRSTFLGWPEITLEDVSPGMLVLAGAPCGYTGSGPGPEFAPAEIRKASQSTLWRWTEPPEGEVVDVLDGTVMRLKGGAGIGDLGDIPIHSPQLERTSQAIADITYEIAKRGGIPICLGGDHYVSFPMIEGVARARGGRLGYIQVDAHLDLQNNNPNHGTHWHGSNARRVAEIEAFAPANMAWIGLEDVCWPEEWSFGQENGCTFVTMRDIRQTSLKAAVEKALAAAADGTDGIYLTIDIDVVLRAYSPGTGHVNFAGLTAAEFLEVMRLLSACPNIIGVDLVEVNPLLDPHGTTSMLASHALTTLLEPWILAARKPA